MKSNRDFESFQRHFTHYQKLFGLTGYKCYFKYEPLKESFADICLDDENRVATIRLNSKLPPENKPHKNIARSAKHEAIHLLLRKLEYMGRCRYVQSEEITEEVESLTFKLEGLIK